jgi:hypothetical protein
MVLTVSGSRSAIVFTHEALGIGGANRDSDAQQNHEISLQNHSHPSALDAL